MSIENNSNVIRMAVQYKESELVADYVNGKRITVFEKLNIIFIESMDGIFSLKYGDCMDCDFISDGYARCLCHMMELSVRVPVMVARGRKDYEYQGLNHCVKKNKSIYMRAYEMMLREKLSSDGMLYYRHGFISFIL